MARSVEAFIFDFEGRQGEVMRFLHHYLTNDLKLRDQMRFKTPFYDGKSWICYLNPIKNQQVELAFVRGYELSNTNGLLLSKGRKQVCGIQIEEIDDANFQVIAATLHEAILLDRNSPYSAKKKPDWSFVF